VSAGHDPCFFTVVRQKPERLVERAGPMIGERRGYHSRSPPRWSCSFFINPSRRPIQYQLNQHQKTPLTAALNHRLGRRLVLPALFGDDCTSTGAPIQSSRG